MIWGLLPHYYMAFVILISFAAYAVILDASGYVLTDQEGNKSTVYSHYLLLGTYVALLYMGCFGIISMVFKN